MASELASLATRRWVDDRKEVQANTAAIRALQMIGGDTCLATMRQILTSREWNNEDVQWDAARIFSDLIGQQFIESSDPVQAAKDWIRANP